MERPTNREIEEAIDVIGRLKSYVEETEPHATVTIENLQAAMDELTANLAEDGT